MSNSRSIEKSRRVTPSMLSVTRSVRNKFFLVLGLVVALLLAEGGAGTGIVFAAQLKANNMNQASSEFKAEALQQQTVASGLESSSEQGSILGTK